MKLAFCLFKYFPYGGLQRDFLRIAKVLKARGHDVQVFTMQWEGPIEPEFKIHIIEAQGRQNHTRIRSFVDKIRALRLPYHFDCVIGFNKMPGLHVYYAADVCYQARAHEKHSILYRMLPRYRQLMAFEKAVFNRGQKTDILMIAPREQQVFMNFYQTEHGRFHLLPPGIAKDRMMPANGNELRWALRNQYHIPNQDFLLLLVGSGFKTKGLDRALLGLASLPEALKNRCHLFVIGQDHPAFFQTLARKLQVNDRIRFLGGRGDVPHFLLGADLLLHPAYHENTGTVLLEALTSGLPVLTVDVCGYAHYVETARAGYVLPSPFQQTQFNATLQKMLLSSEHQQWRQNALAFAEKADIYSLPEKAADIIEYAGKKNDFISAK